MSGHPPLVLGRYRLVRRLGTGGFGTVWLAHDERLDRPVALKRVPVDGAGGGDARAEREALAAARLGHPGIVALYDTGHDDDASYLVSELVRGRTLADLEAEGALSDRDVARVGAELCEALEHAHARGVVHRDVKPGNVMVGDAGEVKLCDFGIARLADHAALTRTGDVVGTLAYMAPEQAEGRRVGPATDLYALALVLYEALTGTNPVRAEGAAATARRVGMRLPALRRLRRDLPPALGDALDRALEPEPADRGTLAELRAALRGAEPRLDDTPGTVEAASTAILTERTRGLWPSPRDKGPDPFSRSAGHENEGTDPWFSRGGRLRLAGRGLAGLSAGALATWAAAELPLRLPVDVPAPAVVGAAVALAVALLPRVAWLLAAVAALAALGAQEATLVAALALAAVPVALLAHARAWWSAPAAAPALGALGLAGAFPALAGHARHGHHRAALGALGALWLAAAAQLAAARPRAGALAAPEVVALAAVWAVAALVLPLFVRGRALVLDVAGGAAWAIAVALATSAAADALGAHPPAGATLGAAVGAGAAVLARAVRL